MGLREGSAEEDSTRGVKRHIQIFCGDHVRSSTLPTGTLADCGKTEVRQPISHDRFSENQRLTLRNGCQTPVFPQPASIADFSRVWPSFLSPCVPWSSAQHWNSSCVPWPVFSTPCDAVSRSWFYPRRARWPRRRYQATAPERGRACEIA